MTGHDDRQDISDVVIRFATGIDRRDWALFRTVFTDDCHVVMGDYGTFDGVKAIAHFEESSHERAGRTLHRITNLAVDVDGDGASARSYVDAWITSPDDKSGINALGFYDDELVRTDDGWRISNRVFTEVRVMVSEA